MKLRIQDVGRLFGKDLPRAGGRGFCPLREHRREDKTFRVYEAKGTGDELYKCWSCDEPDNSGDGVALYALLARVDRKEALLRLREMRFDLGGQPVAPKPPPPLAGVRPEIPAELPPGYVDKLRQDPAGRELVSLFATQRGLDAELCQKHMVGLRTFLGASVGFVYIDPETGSPCRIKVRSSTEKRFFVMPKADRGTPDKKALAPLFLVETLVADRATVALVTEGEPDALALAGLGLENVVSLPDGSKSVETVDLRPIYGFPVWMLSFDADEAGAEAVRQMKKRAKRLGADAVGITWGASKDANEAVKKGLTLEEARRTVDRLLERRYGYPIRWSAA